MGIEYEVAVIRDNFDYTEWRKEFFDEMSPKEFHKAAIEFEKAHPFTGKAVRI